MAKFQVQYKNNSATFTDTFEANSHLEIINLFQSLINAELTEIREIVYTNPIYPKDDGLYYKNVSAFLSDEHNTMCTIKIPKVKKSITTELLANLIKSYIKLNGKSPKNIKINNLF
jgi:hypothetical protein